MCWCVCVSSLSLWQPFLIFSVFSQRHCHSRKTYLVSVGRCSSNLLSQGRAVHCTRKPVTPWEPPMESSIAEFLERRCAEKPSPILTRNYTNDVSYCLLFHPFHIRYISVVPLVAGHSSAYPMEILHESFTFPSESRKLSSCMYWRIYSCSNATALIR